MKIRSLLLLLLSSFIINAKAAPLFEVNQQIIHFTNDGGVSFVKVTMTGKQWTCSSNQEWCSISKTSSSKVIDQIAVIVKANNDKQPRSAQLLFIRDSIDTLRIIVLQTIKASIYPSYYKA